MDPLCFAEDGACMTNESQPVLFAESDIGTPVTSMPPERSPATPRLNKPERLQGEMRCESLDQRLDADHPARVIWKLVEGLDLSCLYERIRAVEGQAGRNPSDPRVL